MYKLKTLSLAILCMAAGTMAGAQSWTLDNNASRIAFGSVKKNTVGEVHSFEQLSGSVSASGAAMVEIDLNSVQTLIDIRNERMVEFVFRKEPKATLSAQIDMAKLNTLAVGDSALVDATGNIALLGDAVDVEMELFVLRVSESKVMVATNDMIMLNMADMGLTAGIDKLMELAKLPGITRVSPVTLRLMFNMNTEKTDTGEATTTTATTQVASAGDAAAGKKVFRKCKACHSLKAGKNGAGPSLAGIIGADAAQSDGFRYSKALQNAGLTWDLETLARFLADPKGYVPGNKMGFRGLRKDADIENVIAYIASGG